MLSLPKSILVVCFALLLTSLGFSGFAFAQEDLQDDTDLQLENTIDGSYNAALELDIQPRPFTEMDFEYEFPDELQRDLPQAAAREIPEPKPRKDPAFDLAFLGPFLKLIFWGILAIAIAYIFYMVAAEIIRARKNYAPKSKEEDLPDIPIYTPNQEQARVLLDDADKLAAEGKYEEAVHVLLFRSIQDIASKRPHYVKRSLTSREISSLPILTQKAKDGFSTIGQLVENSFFGGKALDANDYAVSKAAYKEFAFEKVAR